MFQYVSPRDVSTVTRPATNTLSYIRNWSVSFPTSRLTPPTLWTSVHLNSHPTSELLYLLQSLTSQTRSQIPLPYNYWPPYPHWIIQPPWLSTTSSTSTTVNTKIVLILSEYDDLDPKCFEKVICGVKVFWKSHKIKMNLDKLKSHNGTFNENPTHKRAAST